MRGYYLTIFDYDTDDSIKIEIWDSDYGADELIMSYENSRILFPSEWEFTVENKSPIIFASIEEAYLEKTRSFDGTSKSNFESAVVIGYRLIPCVISLGISIYQENYIIRQIAYYVISTISNNNFSLEKFTLEAFIELVLEKIGHKMVNNLNNFRTFCQCAYEAISK